MSAPSVGSMIRTPRERESTLGRCRGSTRESRVSSGSGQTVNTDPFMKVMVVPLAQR